VTAQTRRCLRSRDEPAGADWEVDLGGSNPEVEPMRDALKCPLCGEVFELKPEDLPEKGLLVVCPRCKHTFELEEAAEFPSYAEGRPSSD